MVSRNKTDVELVIKARNDSTKAFKDILGNIKGLENQLKILGKQSNLVSSFKEAEIQSAKLKKQIDSLSVSQKKLNDSLSKEKRGSDQYKAIRIELTKVNKELRATSTSYKNSQKALTAYANKAESSGTSIDKLIAKERTLTAEITSKQRLLSYELEKKARAEQLAANQKALQGRLKLFKQAKLEAKQNAELRTSTALLAREYRKAGGNFAQWKAIVKSANGDVNKLTTAVNRHVTSKHKEATAIKKSAIEQQKANAKGKQALSYYQRLRSQVIGLAGAYVGLQGASRSVASIFDTQNQLIAAQNRLAVGLGGDREAAADELRFVRAAAEQLKAPVESLIGEYSKFVAASRGLNWSQEQLREVFLGVAKASVVNRLSVADTQGVYRALTQIMSKNQIMAEELRQQLGDRLPGAISIMATATGHATKDLIKLMEQGKLSGEELLKFGRTLGEVYEGQVAEALDSPQAKLNAFRNALFDLRDEIAKSGFIDELTDQLGEIGEEIKTEEVRNGLIGIAKAVGTIAKVLVVLAKNWKIVGTIIGTILGLKIIKFFQGVIGISGKLGATSAKVVSSVGKLGGAFAKFGGVLSRILPFLIRFAGPAGLIASLVFGLVDFTDVTGAATDRGSEYEKMLHKYGASAKTAAEKQKEFNEAIKDAELQRLETEYDPTGVTKFVETARKELEDLQKALGKGGTSVSFGGLGESVFQPIDTDETEQRIKDLTTAIAEATAELKEYGEAKKRIEETGYRGSDFYKIAEMDPDAQKAIKKTSEYVEDARKRQDALLAKSLGDQLTLVKGSNKLRLQENKRNQTEIQKLISEHEKKIVDIRSRARKGESVETLVSAQETSIKELNDQLDQEMIASSLLYKDLTINTAKAIEEFTDSSLSSLRDYISETQDLEGAVDPAVVGQKISAIRNQLETSLVGADGATATAIKAGLRQIDAAYEKFTRGVADKNAKAIKAILTKGLSEIRRISTESQALQGSVDVQSIESEFARMFAELEAKPGEVARATLQTLRVEYAQFFNQLLGENLQQLQAEIDQSVGQSLEQRLAKIRQGYANLRNDFGGKASTADVAALDTTQQQDMQRAGFEAINQLLAQRDQLEFDIEVKRRQGLLTDLEANNQVLMLNEQYRILLMADAELALSNGMNHVAQGATNAANSMQTLNEVQTEMATTINKDLVSGLAGAFDQYVSGAMSAKDAFRQFASDFLRQMAMMILQQKILNSIGGGGLGGAVASVLHDGGIAGSSGTTRSVPSWMFNVAPRFHGGGVVGLASNEVPAVLEKGEGVFTKEQMSSMGQKQGANVRIVNSIEPGFVTDSMSGSEGEQVILNHIRRNSYGIRKMIGG